jgi:recombination protein RecT
MERHANKYSKAFNIDLYRKFVAGKVPQSDLWQCSSFWYQDFDGMAEKTMLRQLISKYGPMSSELLQRAAEADEKTLTINEGKLDYFETLEAEATVENVAPVEEEKPKLRGRKKDPLAGTVFDEAVPDFVAEVEEQ